MDTPTTKSKKIDYWSIFKLQATFNDEISCIQHLEKIIWAQGPYCPYCGNQKIYRFKCLKKYKCGTCRQIFSIRVGTIFQASNLKLTTWFTAIYLLSINKRGISSHNLSRQLGVTQTTAWFMLQRIRYAMTRNNLRRPILSGTVEADECEIGGEERHRQRHIEKYLAKKGRKLKIIPGKTFKKLYNNKAVVAGIMEQGGGVVTKVVPNQLKETLDPFVNYNVEKGSTVYTDSDYAYGSLNKSFTHGIIVHSKKEYVKGNITTNHIENFWKNLQQGLYGCYNWVSHEHLEKYCQEFSFRFSFRDNDARFIFDQLISGCDAGHLPHKILKKDAKKKQKQILEMYELMSVAV